MTASCHEPIALEYHTYHSPQHCNDYCCAKAPGDALAEKSHDDVSKHQQSKRKVGPVGGKEERTSTHCSVLNVGTGQLKLGKKHEEQHDVDWDGEEVDKLGAERIEILMS